ncbi:MAG: hypothetical protein EPO41_03790 [Reyranella sp.]|uniref:hypothetical protein n=1 Tax=Reyranella sp. TaxID=1929291 RepID=UPI00120ECDBA|nr:hypothetical protein [Reyranella sp.]TAJ97123.1 MAG: hypothetical protein EPO41_03790 [Reyranella sp.]
MQTRNNFVIREVDNGWVVEIGGSLERLTSGDVRVYQNSSDIAELLDIYAEKSHSRREAERPVSL